MDRFSQGAFSGPTHIESMPQGIVSDSYFMRPLHDRLSLALKFNNPITSAVIVLLDACCPSAIVRRVVSIIVDAVDAVLWRGALSHIGKERNEVMPPTVADGNASPAIVLESRFTWRIASRNYPAPYYVFGRSFPDYRRAMLGRVLGCVFPAKASTGSSRTGLQVTTIYNDFISAIATAKPTHSLRPEIRGTFKHGQSPVALSGDVYQSGSTCGILEGHRELILSGVGSQGIHGAAGSIYCLAN